MIAALLSFTVACHAASMTEPYPLAGFESQDEVAKMQVRESTRVELVEGDVKEGATAARITFEAIKEGGEQWPAVVIRGESLTLTDFTPYGGLEFWTKNVGDGTAPLHLVIYDAVGGRGYTRPAHLQLKPGEWTHIVAEMPTAGVDLAQVESVHFYQDRNAEEHEIVLDGVRLVATFSVEAERLRGAVTQARTLAREQGVLDRMGQRLGELEEAAGELLAEADGTEADSERAAAILRETLGLVAQADSLSLDIAKERAAKVAGAGGEDYVLVAESSMVKVMPDAAPFEGRPGKPVEIAVAGGEVEAGQIIIAPLRRKLRDVRFSVSELKGPGGQTLPAESVELSAMGYVYTNPDVPPSYPVDRLGWFPDPILPFVETLDVDRDKVQSLWLSITCPRGQRAGAYKGSVTVSPGNSEPQSIPVRVRVFGFDTPRERSLKTAICTFDYQFPRIYGDAWSRQLYWEYVDFLHAHRMNMDRIYRGHEDPPALEDVKRMVAGGQDAWCLRYIVQPGEGGSGTGVDPEKFNAYVDEAIADAKAAYEVFQEAGAEDICYIYFFDEVGVQHYDTLKEAAARVRAALPGVPLMTTARDADYGIRSGVSEAIDIWVPLTPGFNTDQGREDIEKARANGDEVWWYICIGPRRPYANIFIEYDAIEARLLMGAMTQKYRPDGFLYYATTMWGPNDHPIESGPYTDWDPASFRINNGDGSWFCAGPDGPITTIRFENFRDGLEDLEYYKLLERAIEAAGGDDKAAALLAVPEELVAGLTEYSRDPRLLADHRLQIAEAIERLTR